jgi:hypothetical protein
VHLLLFNVSDVCTWWPPKNATQKSFNNFFNIHANPFIFQI